MLKAKWTFGLGMLVWVLLLGACGANEEIVLEEMPPTETEVQVQEPVTEPRVPDLPGGLLVMIDNHPNARPQSGLDKADLVYEILAEGGITRYMALFYSEKSDMVGPVRSARYYYVQLARGMDLPLAHAGGSQEALTMIRNIGVKDMDEIYNSEKYFWRDQSRRAPHNLYTSTDRLTEGAAAKKYEVKTPEMIPESDAFDGESLKGGTLTIDYATGRYRYSVSWVWEEDTGQPGEPGQPGGRYRRLINDETHETLEGDVLTADTIFILEARTRDVVKDGTPMSEIDIVGSGSAVCIVENQVMRGTWAKEAAGEPLRIMDEQGGVMGQKAGKTWIQVVPAMRNVHYELETEVHTAPDPTDDPE
ncbi:MAG: DUF3048 domain-containing protein [Peptococcaceae bacterium]|jgi:hypothetical protein|nr:DUF3048 domain-containing protein [Peptococcaceae bacterium]